MRRLGNADYKELKLTRRLIVGRGSKARYSTKPGPMTRHYTDWPQS
jgi:hypothetical protein